jgi:DNA-binding NarL/FixJ family response regulator
MPAEVHPEQRKIFVVDDQALIREGLARVINRHKDLVCCGGADSIVGAREAIEAHKPDLVVADLLLPDGSGLEMIKAFVSENPSLPILVISQCDETLYAERALKAGARGFVMKNCALSEIPRAIRSLLAGEFYVSAKVAELALHQMSCGKPKKQGDGVATLTDRELLVFELLGAGTDTKDVAAKLHISVKTVETHRENIKHKLKLSGASELIRHATNWVSSQASLRPSPASAEKFSGEDLSSPS